MKIADVPAASLVAAVIIIVTSALPALGLEHAIEGVVTRVDSTAKQIAVKTADGTEEVFKLTVKTAVFAAQGAKRGAADSYLAGKEGTHVVVRYTSKGADKTAVTIDDFGNDTVEVGKGAITRVDKAAHTVTVRTEEGSEETYHLAEHATADTGRGVIKASEYSAKKGEKVSVHYTEEAGKKVAHFIKHL